MRPSVQRYTFLQVLEEADDFGLDFLSAFLASVYSPSIKKIEYEMDRAAHRRVCREQERLARARFANMVSILKKDGLISVKKVGEKKFLNLTPWGKNKLQFFKKNPPHLLPTPKHYSKERHSHWVIVAFDIPEKFRSARRWVRESLRELGFVMVQKSVWVGKVKIPQAFLKDLRVEKVSQYVEIFEMGKAGTLSKLG